MRPLRSPVPRVPPTYGSVQWRDILPGFSSAMASGGGYAPRSQWEAIAQIGQGLMAAPAHALANKQQEFERQQEMERERIEAEYEAEERRLKAEDRKLQAELLAERRRVEAEDRERKEKELADEAAQRERLSDTLHNVRGGPLAPEDQVLQEGLLSGDVGAEDLYKVLSGEKEDARRAELAEQGLQTRMIAPGVMEVRDPVSNRIYTQSVASPRAAKPEKPKPPRSIELSVGERNDLWNEVQMVLAQEDGLLDLQPDELREALRRQKSDPAYKNRRDETFSRLYAAKTRAIERARQAGDRARMQAREEAARNSAADAGLPQGAPASGTPTSVTPKGRQDTQGVETILERPASEVQDDSAARALIDQRIRAINSQLGGTPDNEEIARQMFEKLVEQNPRLPASEIIRRIEEQMKQAYVQSLEPQTQF